MTIENARVLQEQLANEAIVQQQKNGSRELADDCIQSIAIVGKAWGIPADETTRWQHAQQKQTRRVGGAEPRENTADSDMLHPAPGKAVKVMQLVWDMFETALDLGDDADRYDCTEIWESDDWKTGGGNISIVRVLQVLDDLADNMAADTNPDHELRMSVIVLDMDKEPQITFEDSAYIRKLMNYTVEKTGEHEWTITVEHNGFVSFTVTREDDAAEPDEPVVPPVPVHPAPVSRPTQTKPAYDFADVRSGAWYYGDVMYAAENGLMNGTSGSTFSPLENLTRAQLTAVLYRMDGSPAVSGTCSFTDAKRGAYYADALVWAERNALVNGYGSGAFGVGDAITREQLVTILYRYAAYKGIDVSARADLSGYRDAEKISGFARDAFGWAVEAGLIRGSGDLLNPQGRTTRAEYAAIAARFHKTFIAK